MRIWLASCNYTRNILNYWLNSFLARKTSIVRSLRTHGTFSQLDGTFMKLFRYMSENGIVAHQIPDMWIFLIFYFFYNLKLV